MKINQYKNAEHTIREVLRIYPETRNDDRELILKVWEVEGLELTPIQKQFFLKVMPAETIRRTRQKIQESGELKADDSVAHNRHIRADATRKHFRDDRKPCRYEIVNNRAIPIYE